MNNRGYLLSLVLACALVIMGGLIGVAIAGRTASLDTTEAQRATTKTDRTEKWEYCSLTKAVVGPNRGGLYWISYFRNNGVQVVEVEEEASERGGPAKAIAKLGEDGWEMVGQGQLENRQGGLNALYFKRPKP